MQRRSPGGSQVEYRVPRAENPYRMGWRLLLIWNIIGGEHGGSFRRIESAVYRQTSKQDDRIASFRARKYLTKS